MSLSLTKSDCPVYIIVIDTVVTRNQIPDRDTPHSTEETNQSATTSVINSWCETAFQSNNLFSSWDLNLEEIKSTDSITPTPVNLVSSSIDQKYLITSDYRFGHITIQGFDSSSDSSETGYNMNIRARFMGEGVIRLYRSWETPETDDDNDNYDDNGSINNKGDDGTSPGGEDHGPKNCVTNVVNRSSDGTMLAILAVPSYLTSSDFYGFIGQNARDNVSHFRFLHNYDHSPNRYMALLKFRSSESASKFLNEYNGKQFNSFESENCHVLQVSQIYYNMMLSEMAKPGDLEYINPVADNGDDNNDGDDEIPYLLDDPFITRPRTRQVRDKNDTHSRPLPPPTPALSELPTCPVCLERMDATTTGLMTIRCQHTFHCSCLSKWHDGSCPVCRYVQPLTIPKLTRAAHNGGQNHQDSLGLVADRDRSVPLCSVCGSLENLWICLVCGNIGCSRYDDAHAFDHYKRTNHIFSMDLATQRVWDYISDGYVHRLIQNSIDGKVVEVEGGTVNGNRNRGVNNDTGDYNNNDNNDNISMIPNSKGNNSNGKKIDLELGQYGGSPGTYNGSQGDKYDIDKLKVLDVNGIFSNVDSKGHPNDKIVEDTGLHPFNGKYGYDDYDFYEDDSNDIAMQFTYLLASQLDNQREYYEAQLSQAADKFHLTVCENSQQAQELELLHRKSQQLHEDNQELNHKVRQLDKLQDKFTKLSNNYSVLHNQYQDEKRINERMAEKLKKVMEDVEAQKVEKGKLNDKISDLSDQLRDLMVSLDFQGQLQHATEDVQMGTVVIPEAPSGSGSSAKRGKKIKKPKKPPAKLE